MRGHGAVAGLECALTGKHATTAGLSLVARFVRGGAAGLRRRRRRHWAGGVAAVGGGAVHGGGERSTAELGTLGVATAGGAVRCCCAVVLAAGHGDWARRRLSSVRGGEDGDEGGAGLKNWG